MAVWLCTQVDAEGRQSEAAALKIMDCFMLVRMHMPCGSSCLQCSLHRMREDRTTYEADGVQEDDVVV